MKIGILGGGQLARMLAIAAYRLGYETLCYDLLPNSSASFVTEVMVADFFDESSLKVFAESVDVITYETENIPMAVINFLKESRYVYPSYLAIQAGQDRLLEKQLLQSLKIPTTEFYDITSLSSLKSAVKSVGLPCVLKTRQLGYDGKGQFIIKTESEIETAWQNLQGQPLILEAFVQFERELSIIAVRNVQNEIVYYPLTENFHRDGILRYSKAPFENSGLEEQARHYAKDILEKLDYIGVLTIEFFQVENELIANEIAPRVHNSGHWTIEGAVTSQFENHIRAIAGLPLGSTKTRGFSAMVNCIGEMPKPEKILTIADAHYHTYQKPERENRKVGHITLVSPDYVHLQKDFEVLLQLCS